MLQADLVFLYVQCTCTKLYRFNVQQLLIISMLKLPVRQYNRPADLHLYSNTLEIIHVDNS